jgi:tetratricopeptide (TPR) repeat protein
VVKNGLARLRWGYRKKAAGGLLVTVSFFLVVESFLAICQFESLPVRRDPYIDFASQAPLFVEQTHDDIIVLETAVNKRGFFNAQRFQKEKPDNTTRIFCLGGSTTFGRPYDDRTSFVGWLRELLEVAADDRQWEVINAGGISYASYRVAEVMEELCEYSPDVFVVYTGHNEFLEERSYRDQRADPAVARRLNAIFGKTRTYSLAHRLLRRENAQTDRRTILSGEVDAILDHAAGPTSYYRDEPLREDILEHFEFNLIRMVETARSAGAEILFVSPAANLKDCSPFKSQHRSNLDDSERRQWSESFAKASVLEESNDLDAGLAELENANGIDSQRADLHFRRGRLLFAQERFAEARAAFLRAIDEDVCPLRALPSMERIIERTARSHDVALVEFDSILSSDCLRRYGHDSLGNEYFFDHVHPTLNANRLLATAIVDAMAEDGSVTLNTLWREEAVAIVSGRISSRLDPELRSRGLTNLAQVLSWAGKQVEAGPIAIEAVRLRAEQGLAADPESLFYAAVHFAMVGSDAKAMELLQTILEHDPDHARARWRLATLLYDQSEYDEAKYHFREAVRLNPSDAYSHHMLGGISLIFKQFGEALESLKQAARLTPDDAAICLDIAFTFQQLGRDQDAIEWYRKAIRLGVDAPSVDEQLRQLLTTTGRPMESTD